MTEIVLRLEVAASPEILAAIERLTLAVRDCVQMGFRNSAAADGPQDGGVEAAPLPQPTPQRVTVSSLPSPETEKPPAVFLDEAAAQAEEKHCRTWTVERDIELTQMKACGQTWNKIYVAMNALQGDAVASGEACAQRYYKLRNAGALPPVNLPPEAAAPEVKPAAPKAALPVAKAVPTAGLREALRAELPVKLLASGAERMSLPEARAWAAQRGLCNGYDGAFNLAEVNQKRAQLGLQKIELVVGR